MRPILLLAVFSLFRLSEGNSSCEGKTRLRLVSSRFSLLALVCVKTIEKFTATLNEGEKSDPSKIEANLKTFCAKVPVDSKEDRLVSFPFRDDAFIEVFLSVTTSGRRKRRPLTPSVISPNRSRGEFQSRRSVANVWRKRIRRSAN